MQRVAMTATSLASVINHVHAIDRVWRDVRVGSWQMPVHSALGLHDIAYPDMCIDLPLANRGPEASCSGRGIQQRSAVLRQNCCSNLHKKNSSSTFSRQGFSQQSRRYRAVLESELLELISASVPSNTPLADALGLNDIQDSRNTAQILQQALGDGCEQDCKKALKVAVLLSGGVDSSLALHLLRQAGHQVTAFYLQIWFQEDFANFWGACPWEDDLEVCQKVCEKEGVHLEVVPLTQQYWEKVVTGSIDSIRRGLTPNPDVLCNSRVKFGAFLDYLEANHQGNFDRIASGHYARLVRGEKGDGPVSLHMTPDVIKDQTYFLASLSQKQLSRVMFPIGSLTKAETRRLATTAELPNNLRRDSQGICFLGKVRFEDFVQAHLGKWSGPLVDEDTNEVVGYHDGFWFYTPGQRKGIFLSGGPWYVSRKNIRKNVVYISRQYYAAEKIRDQFCCGSFSWISGEPPTSSTLQCKVRHGPQLYSCQFSLHGDTATVQLDGRDQGIAAGQYAVFYQDGQCLGSAVIMASIPQKDLESRKEGLSLLKPEMPIKT